VDLQNSRPESLNVAHSGTYFDALLLLHPTAVDWQPIIDLISVLCMRVNYSVLSGHFSARPSLFYTKFENGEFRDQPVAHGRY